jgi:hypothetical protein
MSKDKTKIQMGAPGAPLGSMLPQIASKADGGKVAVMERGKKPQIFDAKTLAAQEEQVIPIPAESADMIKESIGKLQVADVQLGQILNQFEVNKAKLLDQRKNREGELQNLIGSVGRRLKVPQGWTLDLDRIVFIPAPPRSLP